jgi:23S rRNA-/tRNA-specific pseudouridylate synthase
VTRIRAVSATSEATHLIVEIETGVTHQIRRHVASIGHPVLGDRQYGTRVPVTDGALDAPRQMLHAAALEFIHPFEGTRVRQEAPLPGDFRACLRRLGLR